MANPRKDYEFKRRKTRDDLLQLQKEVRSLADKRMDLERLERKKSDYLRLVSLQKDQENQREKLHFSQAYGFYAQRMAIEIRVAMLDRDIRQKEQEIDSLKQSCWGVIAEAEMVEKEHQDLKAAQNKIQNELNRGQTSLGQHQAFCQINKNTIKETPKAAISKTIPEWDAEVELVKGIFVDTAQEVKKLGNEILGIKQQISAFSDKTSLNRFPEHVKWFSDRLRERGIEHHLLALYFPLTADSPIR